MKTHPGCNCLHCDLFPPLPSPLFSTTVPNCPVCPSCCPSTLGRCGQQRCPYCMSPLVKSQECICCCKKQNSCGHTQGCCMNNEESEKCRENVPCYLQCPPPFCCPAAPNHSPNFCCSQIPMCMQPNCFFHAPSCPTLHPQSCCNLHEYQTNSCKSKDDQKQTLFGTKCYECSSDNCICCYPCKRPKSVEIIGSKLVRVGDVSKRNGLQDPFCCKAETEQNFNKNICKCKSETRPEICARCKKVKCNKNVRINEKCIYYNS